MTEQVPAAWGGQAPPVQSTPTTRTTDERRSALARHVQMAVARGGRVESQSDYNAVVVFGSKVNHVLHFLIGVFTLGLWWVVWIVLALIGGEKREMVTVDDFGNVAVQRV